METKKCSHCRKEQPISKYWKNKSKKDGLNYVCIDCYREVDKKRYYSNLEKNRGVKILTSKKMLLLYPEKSRARRLLRYAVKIGSVIKLPCKVCGSKKSQGHHDDYNKPLEVVWLCQIHHSEQHKLLATKKEGIHEE